MYFVLPRVSINNAAILPGYLAPNTSRHISVKTRGPHNTTPADILTRNQYLDNACTSTGKNHVHIDTYLCKEGSRPELI